MEKSFKLVFVVSWSAAVALGHADISKKDVLMQPPVIFRHNMLTLGAKTLHRQQWRENTALLALSRSSSVLFLNSFSSASFLRLHPSALSLSIF